MDISMRTLFLLVVSLLNVTGIALAQPFRYVVAADGSGTHTSVQAAIDACPDNQRSLIFIKNGVYEERVSVGSKAAPSAKLLSLIGESAEGVIITSSGSRDSQGSFYDIVTVQIYAKDFYAENLTIRNTAGNVGQAEALFNGTDRQTFKNCRILGYQDTHRSNKGARCYFKDCLIEGAVDFIYAGGVIFFDDCTLHCVKGGGYIVAPEDCIKNIRRTDTATGVFLHIGFFFRNCLITANEDVPENSYYLGRPWKENSGAYYLNCKMGKHIRPVGWQTWGGSEATATFGEYNSMDMEGNPLDVSSRASWSMQLPEADVTNILTPEFIYNWVDGANKYQPQTYCTAPNAPATLRVEGNKLSWEGVDNVAGYLVFKDDAYLAYVATNTFTDHTGTTGVYSVRAVSPTGALGASAGSAPTSLRKREISDKEVSVCGNRIDWPFDADARLYSPDGKCIGHLYGSSVSVPGKGMYILQLTQKSGIQMNKKIVIK